MSFLLYSKCGCRPGASKLSLAQEKYSWKIQRIAPKTPMMHTIEIKTTPGEGDEGFEGPPYRQSLEEDDASDASKDVNSLSKEVGENDVEILSNKAKIRAEQLVIARAAESVKSDPGKAGTANITLEDGESREIVAPESEATEKASIKKFKARILGKKAEEGRDQEMSSYKTKQQVTSLSRKADDATIELPS